MFRWFQPSGCRDGPGKLNLLRWLVRALGGAGANRQHQTHLQAKVSATRVHAPRHSKIAASFTGAGQTH